MKAVIDRLHNPIRDQFGIKQTVLLGCCADQGDEVGMPMQATYKAIIDYLGWQDRGMLIVQQVEEKGAIKENEGLEKARALGLSIE